MNTMVGMQATSLHTPTEDSFSELMKSDTQLDTSGVMNMGVAANASSANVDIEASEDYFDPNELLMSPLFNDSNGRLEVDEESFGNFGGSNNNNNNNSNNGHGGGSCSVPNNNHNNGNMNRNNNMMNGNGEPKREFVPMGLRRSDDAGFAPMKPHTQTIMTPQNHASYVGGGDSSYGGDNVSYVGGGGMSNNMNNNMNSNDGDMYGEMGMAYMQQQQQQQQQNFQNSGMENVASFHSGGMDNSGSSSHNQYNNSSNNNNNGGNQFNSYRGNQMMGDDSSHAEFAHDDSCSVNMVNPYLMSNNNNGNNHNASFYRSAPDRSNSSASSSYGSDMTPAPRAASAAMLDLTQDNNHSGPMFRRAAPQRSQTYHPGGENSNNYSGMSLQRMQQQFQLQQQMQEHQQEYCGEDDGGGDDNNQLEMMQNHLLQMQDLEQMQQQLLEQQQLQQQQQQGSMDHSGNGLPGSGMVSSRSMHLPSRSVSCGPMGTSSFHGNRAMRGMRRGGPAAMMGANDLEAMQAELSQSGMMGTNANGGPVTVNDAMEKLCESMKRSAMSRTLVKQFSGRGGVARTTSGSGMIMAMAGRNNAGRQASNRSLVMDDSSHRSTENRPAVPVRRMSNTKHHLQSRGVYRHGSRDLNGMRDLVNGGGGNNHHGNGTGGNLSFQIDGRNMGSL